MNYEVPRVQALPVADDQVSFKIDGVERARWHFGRRYPRPFFYPLIGPSGRPVTRMGHPAAPDHDHHRSVWFAHQNVAGVSFWEEGKEPQIRQEHWILYEDGAEEAAMVVELGWYDAHHTRLMRQHLVAVLRPVTRQGSDEPLGLGEVEFEVQATFTPELDSLELGKTNFGFFAVRVAKSISAHYGGGHLTNSEGATGEKNIHQKVARWVDYSGPVVGHTWEGITYFDHPSNPGQPTLWHVRDDGWMEASFNQRGPYELKKDQPLVLRYLLHVHRGDLDAARAAARVAATRQSLRLGIGLSESLRQRFDQ
ncbi:MAG: PmoA family protein [Planctomycetes bacterium]|nr:PmoA family protein [Planctomycetota bacterium]